jgi:hypothetical protein
MPSCFRISICGKQDRSVDDIEAAMLTPHKSPENHASTANDGGLIRSPSISLARGSGAIPVIGEKFAANLVTGIASMSAPLAVSPGVSTLLPYLSDAYDSGAYSRSFDFSWSLSLVSSTRKPTKNLPQYHDADESDVFFLSGAGSRGLLSMQKLWDRVS